MSEEGNHGPKGPKGFFDEHHIIDAIIGWVVQRRGLPPGYTREDLKQDALLKFFSWLQTGRVVDNPAAFFRTLVQNVLEDKHRHYQAGCRDYRKEEWVDAPEGDETHWLVGRGQDVRDRILIDELYAMLSGDERMIFEQYIYENRSLTDIAQELGVSKQAVGARWARILKELKKRLRPLV